MIDRRRPSRSTTPPVRAPLKERVAAALPKSEHALRLWTGSLMWLSMTLSILALSFVPGVVPDDVVYWRVVLSVPALIFVLLHIPAARYLSDEQSYVATVVGAYLGTAVFFVLFQISPATWALLMGLMVPGIFVGYFLRLRELFPLLVFITFVSLSSLLSPYADQTVHLEARLVAYVAALWAMVMALHLQKRDLLTAMADVSEKTFTDPLTGLANLRALRRKAAELLAESGRGPNSSVALLMIDLDNFKQANTIYGHLGGDLTLRTVAEQLERVLPPDALAARIGGDEFAVLVKRESPQELEEFAGLLRGAVKGSRAEMPLADIAIDASVGFAIAPRDGDTLDELVAAADEAMYAEKSTHESASTSRLGIADANQRREAEEKARIAWQDHESERLDRKVPNIPGARFFASRTDITLYAFLGYLIGSVALAVAFAVPGADNDYLTEAYLVLLIGPAFSIAVLFWNPPNRARPHYAIDLFTVCCLIAIAALSGGQASPAAPLIYLLIIHQAWFWESRAALWRLLTLTAVVMMPITYQGLSGEGAAVISGAAFYSTLGTSLILSLSLYLNQYSTAVAGRRAKQLSQTDPLTGIPNRRAFNEFVEAQLHQRRGNREFAIVMIDLDNFKDVNTVHGHKYGDTLLSSIAESLEHAARDNDCVARVGGDEFAAALPGAGVDGARALAERFVAAVEQCAKRRGDSVSSSVTASAGFALSPLHGDSLDDLVRAADDALMSVKGSGKGAARVGRHVTAI